MHWMTKGCCEAGDNHSPLNTKHVSEEVWGKIQRQIESKCRLLFFFHHRCFQTISPFLRSWRSVFRSGWRSGFFFSPVRRAWVEFTRYVRVYKEMLSSASHRLNEVSPRCCWQPVDVAHGSHRTAGLTAGTPICGILEAGTSPPYSASRDGLGRCCCSVRLPSIWSWHRSLIWLINRALNPLYWSDRKRCGMRCKQGGLLKVRFQRPPRVTRPAQN